MEGVKPNHLGDFPAMLTAKLGRVPTVVEIQQAAAACLRIPVAVLLSKSQAPQVAQSWHAAVIPMALSIDSSANRHHIEKIEVFERDTSQYLGPLV